MHFCVFFKIIRQCIVELIFPRLWSAFISMTRTRAIIIMNLMNYKDLPTRHWKQILTTTKNTHLHNSVGEALCVTCWNLFAAGWNWFITHSQLLRCCNMISVVILHGSLLKSASSQSHAGDIVWSFGYWIVLLVHLFPEFILNIFHR